MAGSVEFMLLGVAQDAGVPQIGCSCPNCTAVWSGELPEQTAASAAIIDHDARVAWLADAGPDIKHQYRRLQTHAPGYALGGVLLTHLHMGHYLGLAQFGREAMDIKGLKVYGTPSVCEALRANKPWSNYVAGGNLDLCSWGADGGALRLSPAVSVSPLPVPHRAEFSDCVALVVQGPRQRLLYCPDVDSWDALQQAGGATIEQLVSCVDRAFLDATFYDLSELGPAGRDPREIPHPLVIDSVRRLAGLAGKVTFVHLNHTNPLWQADSPQRAGVLAAGFGIGQQGAVYEL